MNILLQNHVSRLGVESLREKQLEGHLIIASQSRPEVHEAFVSLPTEQVYGKSWDPTIYHAPYTLPSQR